jgi:hypothetical protein
MPIPSPIYGLEFHTEGEIYSASADRRRFLIIDNHLAFMSDMIGDGRIIGWSVSEESADEYSIFQVKINSGFGLIDKFATFTYGDSFVDLTDNRTVYLYMRRKQGIIGGFSRFTDLSPIVVSDTVSPSTPTGLSILGSYNENLISWNSNTEPDLSFYTLEKSLNNIDWTDLTTVSFGTTSYTDTGLTQNTNYYYRISATDFSGNESVVSASVLSKTLRDLRQPLPVGRLRSFPIDSGIQLLWEESPSDFTSSYSVVIQALDESQESVGSPIVTSVSLSKTYTIIKELVNEASYSLTVYALNSNGVASEGVNLVDVPSATQGPQDVDDVTVSFSEGDNEEINVVMTVSITIGLDPYLVPADRYYITLVENAKDVSDPIVFLEDQVSREIRIIPFSDSEGTISYRSIKEETRYLIRVVGVDADGLESNGVIIQVDTPTFKTPAPVSNASVDQQANNDLVGNWINSPSSILSHNLVTVKKKNIITLVETTIVDEENIGIASTYVLDSSYVEESMLFTFEIVAVDIYDNNSITVTSLFQIGTTDDNDKPNSPSGLKANAGNGSVSLEWDAVDVNEISTVGVWRADFGLFADQSDFVELVTLTSDNTQFIDYNVVNNSRYMYLMSATSFLGVESFNPTDDYIGVIDYVDSKPVATGDLTPPENLTITQSGFDAILDWDLGAGEYDGYEIYRSVGNIYSFTSIGNVLPTVSLYIDEDILLQNGQTVYYMVRKFRNESDPFVTESSVLPAGSILLAKIVTSGGAVSIDESVATELLDLEDPVRTETQIQLALHEHVVEDDGTDKRIDLKSAIEIDNWATSDYQNYFTASDIEGAGAYLVSVSGTVNESFFTNDAGEVDQASVLSAERGTPPLLFEVDDTDGRLTFEFPLFGSDSTTTNLSSSNLDTSTTTSNQLSSLELGIKTDAQGNVLFPYSDEPVISVKLVGVTEIQNTLPPEKIENFSATQVKSSRIDLLQMPTVNHQGRMGEWLIPTSHTMISSDQFTYSFLDTSNSISSNALTFYDFLYISGDKVIAATSQGILSSSDFGNSWTNVLQPQTAPHKIFHASGLNKYFVLTNDGVYVSEGDLDSWVRMAGLENTKVVRDIIEDGNSNLYCSTDLGVYKLTFSTADKFFSWTQTTLFGPRSTESYAMFYDSSQDRILVSNELGVLESSNAGSTWSFTDEFNELKKIFVFLGSGTTIFAITDDEIYRKKTGNFEKVAELEVSISRLMIIFEDRLYVSTDQGIYASIFEGDIIDDSALTMRRILPQININDNAVPVTGLGVVDDKLFIGIDQKVYMRKGNDIWLQYEDVSGPVPSVFVNNVLQKLGVFYFSPLNIVSFDDSIGVNDTISTAVVYTEYIASNEGWAAQKYSARVKIVVNNEEIADTDDLTDGIQLTESEFSGFTFPDYTDQNANLITATEYETSAQSEIDRLVSIISGVPVSGETEASTLTGGEALYDVVSNVYLLLEQFMSQIYASVRATVALPSIPVTISSGVQYDVLTGKFTFNSPYSKYDKLQIDVIGVTIDDIGDNSHGEVEDSMELVNSGLPSSLSQIQHANIVKMGIFHQKQWPDENLIRGIPYQAKYNVPYNQTWYNELSSTVDWQIQFQQSSVTPSIPYVSSSLYISDESKVFVGGSGAMLSITSETLEVSEIEVDSSLLRFKQIYKGPEKTYAVTEYDLYSSEDNGETWDKESRDGLPNLLYSIGIVNQTRVLGTENGLYFKTDLLDEWVLGLASTSPVEIIVVPDILFAIVDNTVYYTGDGANWSQSGQAQTLSIHAFDKFKSLIFVGTDSGLYKDDGTFYGSGATLSLVDIFSSPSESIDIVVNDVVSDTDRLIVGLSDGRVAILYNNVWTVLTGSNLTVIHKILAVGDRIWFFGDNMLSIAEGTGSSLNFTSFVGSPVLVNTGALA